MPQAIQPYVNDTIPLLYYIVYASLKCCCTCCMWELLKPPRIRRQSVLQSHFDSCGKLEVCVSLYAHNCTTKCVNHCPVERRKMSATKTEARERFHDNAKLYRRVLATQLVVVYIALLYTLCVYNHILYILALVQCVCHNLGCHV